MHVGGDGKARAVLDLGEDGKRLFEPKSAGARGAGAVRLVEGALIDEADVEPRRRSPSALAPSPAHARGSPARKVLQSARAERLARSKPSRSRAVPWAAGIGAGSHAPYSAPKRRLANALGDVLACHISFPCRGPRVGHDACLRTRGGHHEKTYCGIHWYICAGADRLRRGRHRRHGNRRDIDRHSRHCHGVRACHRRDGLRHRPGLGLPRQSGGELRRAGRGPNDHVGFHHVCDRAGAWRHRRRCRALSHPLGQGLGLDGVARPERLGPRLSRRVQHHCGIRLRGGRHLPVPRLHPRRHAKRRSGRACGSRHRLDSRRHPSARHQRHRHLGQPCPLAWAGHRRRGRQPACARASLAVYRGAADWCRHRRLFVQVGHPGG